MKKSIKTISNLGAIVSVSIGAIMLIKGMQGEGIFWLAISGTVIIFSGILNIILVGAGVFDALELFLKKAIKTIEQRIQ